MQQEFIVTSLNETAEAARVIAEQLSFPACVYLHGQMGAGKTTLTGSLINAMGYQGAVTSPTYNLIQEYQVDEGIVYHMDLYRLEDPAELEFLALEDLWSDHSMFLIEWPQNGASLLPPATIEIYLETLHDEGVKKRKIMLKK